MSKFKYYNEDGYMNEEAFEKELAKIHNQIEEGATVEELKKIRKRLYYLRKKYEECGSYNLDIELEIQCVNEFLHN